MNTDDSKKPSSSKTNDEIAAKSAEDKKKKEAKMKRDEEQRLKTLNAAVEALKLRATRKGEPPKYVRVKKTESKGAVPKIREIEPVASTSTADISILEPDTPTRTRQEINDSLQSLLLLLSIWNWCDETIAKNKEQEEKASEKKSKDRRRKK